MFLTCHDVIDECADRRITRGDFCPKKCDDEKKVTFIATPQSSHYDSLCIFDIFKLCFSNLNIKRRCRLYILQRRNSMNMIYIKEPAILKRDGIRDALNGMYQSALSVAMCG